VRTSGGSQSHEATWAFVLQLLSNTIKERDGRAIERKEEHKSAGKVHQQDASATDRHNCFPLQKGADNLK